MVVSILILEETLSIESFSVNQELKLFLNISHVFMVILIWLTLAIDWLSSGIIKRNIYRLLKIFFGEYFIDAVTKLSPANMGSCLWCLESFGEKSEFSSGKHDFTHVQSNSELGFSDISTSQFIEISKEFSDSNSLFFASLSQLGNDIIDIIRQILLDINSCNSWSSLWVVIEWVVVASSDTEKLLRGVDIIAEVEVVDLINISFIHVCFQQDIKNVLWCRNTQLSQSSQELMFRNVLISSDIEVLEHWFHMDSLDFHSPLVFL